jgi:MFS family permease
VAEVESLTRPEQEIVALCAALLLTALGSGLSPALLAVAGTPLVAGLAAWAIGGTQAAFIVLMLAVLLDLVPDDLRGHASGLFLMTNAGMMAVANLVLGVIAGYTSPTLPLALPGLAVAALFAVGALLWPDALQRVARPPIAPGVPPETPCRGSRPLAIDYTGRAGRASEGRSHARRWTRARR